MGQLRMPAMDAAQPTTQLDYYHVDINVCKVTTHFTMGGLIYPHVKINH